MPDSATALQELSGGDLSSVDANVMARILSSATAAELDAVLSDPARRQALLDEVFRRMASHARAERIGSMHSVVHLQLTGGTGTDGLDRYQWVLSDGACVVSEELTEQPRVTITVSAAHFLRMITQQETPAVLFITGDLKVRGDLGFAAGLIGYFDLPAG